MKVIASFEAGPHLWNKRMKPLMVVIVEGDRLKYEREKEISRLWIGKEMLESDAKDAKYGGLLVEKLIDPYKPIQGGEYLERVEIEGKKRLIREMIYDLALEYRMALSGLRIDPAFFYYERLKRLTKLSPIARVKYRRLLEHHDLVKRCVDGFRKAAKELEKEGFLFFEGDLIGVDERVVGEMLRGDLGIAKLSRILERSFKVLGALSKVFGEMLEYPIELSRPEDIESKDLIYAKTSYGLQRISRIGKIEKIAKRILGGEVRIRKLKGVINSVFLASNEEGESVVLKKFEEWYSIKWAVVSIWALGSSFFDVLGKSRMANEYAMSLKLEKEGFDVPNVVGVYWDDKVMAKEFIRGENIDDVAKRILWGESDDYEKISKVGELMGKLHSREIILGDSKPENFISQNGRIYVVDLEQARKGRDFSTDVGIFLYYAARTAFKIDKIGGFVRAFAEGYGVESDIENIRKAAHWNLQRIFSFLVPPQAIASVAKACTSL